MRFWLGVFALTTLIVNCGCQRSSSSVAPDGPAQSKEQPPAGQSEEEVFEQLAKSQVEVGDASLVRIVDRKAWPSAPVPDATVIVGIARHPEQDAAKSRDGYDYFSFVLLAAGRARAKQPSLISLGLVVPDLPVDTGSQNRPLSVDVSPIKIRADEYAFGIRHLVGEVGKKSGRLYEVMSLYRFHDAALKEIFRDVVWVYDKHSEHYGSCNVEMKVVQQQSQVEGFYDIAREFSRSYLGDTMNPPLSNESAQPEAAAECSLSHELRAPNVQKWDPTLDEYLNAKGRFLHWDDLFKRRPFP